MNRDGFVARKILHFVNISRLGEGDRRLWEL
jgi:hypothetical protein